MFCYSYQLSLSLIRIYDTFQTTPLLARVGGEDRCRSGIRRFRDFHVESSAS